MALWGSIVNSIAIIVGACIGLSVRFGENIQSTIMQGLGLAVIIIGITMGLSSENILIPIASLVIGGVIGETLRIEERLAALGDLLGRWSHQKGEGPGVTEGFLTASLVYCVGAMAVLGALDSGLHKSHDVLYAKSMLDGVSAIFFASSLGVGVAFSALPVFVYQGSIALLANLLAPLFHPAAMLELTSTGGMLILGIGINILGISKIAVGNLLPSIGVAVILTMFF